MTPRTKAEKDVVVLSDKLKDITQKDFLYATKKAFYVKAYKVGQHSYWCSECGQSFSSESNPKVCPHCKKKFEKIEETKKRSDKCRDYFAIADVAKDWQVLRIFRIDKGVAKGKPAESYVWEVIQYWYSPRQFHIMARTRTMGIYCDTFVYDSELSLKQQPRYGCHLKNFPYSFCIEKKVLKQFSGFVFKNERCEDIGRAALYELVCKNNMAETMAKQGQWKVIALLYNRQKLDAEHFAAVKIANRNHYPIYEFCHDWLDMVEALLYLHKDVHNAHYVCPANLAESHDYWIGKMERQKERIARERDREEYMRNLERDRKADEKYQSARKRFFGLELTSGSIVISVLPNVEAFKEEGRAMHHCVYANRYFEHLGSLIMSARVNGIRAETIEVNLSNYTISQSRGVCNKQTEHHESIVELVQNNMHRIKELNEFRRHKSRAKV